MFKVSSESSGLKDEDPFNLPWELRVCGQQAEQ